ncbi:MAG: PaaI family thioesterase [Psychromonas sp.]|nr:PaaI family thioesterase [Psychromonas sp.]
MDLTEKINLKVMSLKGDDSIQPLQIQKKQKSHQYCMLCGPQSQLGLKLDFYSNAEEVWTIVRGSIHQQGYQGLLHGGFLAALLDAVMCQAVFNQQAEAVTADMNIRFLHKVPMNSELLLKGKIISHFSTLYKVEAEIYVEDKLMVKANARFMKSDSKNEK